MNRGHQQREKNASQCWHETCPRVSATVELLGAAQGDWEGEFRKDVYDLPFLFPPVLKRSRGFQAIGTCCGLSELLMVLRRLLANGVYTIYSSSDTLSTLLILL